MLKNKLNNAKTQRWAFYWTRDSVTSRRWTSDNPESVSCFASYLETHLRKTLFFVSQVEIPNIQKQRKHLAKLVLDMDSARTRWVIHACVCVCLCARNSAATLHLLWMSCCWSFPQKSSDLTGHCKAAASVWKTLTVAVIKRCSSVWCDFGLLRLLLGLKYYKQLILQ